MSNLADLTRCATEASGYEGVFAFLLNLDLGHRGKDEGAIRVLRGQQGLRDFTLITPSSIEVSGIEDKQIWRKMTKVALHCDSLLFLHRCACRA